jgi:NADH-quinone oxidoreductase subunit A
VDDYLPIVLLLAVGLLFASLSFVASGLLGPRKRPTAAKTAPYECGIVPQIEPPARFPVRFYLIAMIFIIFDIEIVFLYPWAVIFRQLGSFGLVEVVVFAAVVFISFLFLVSNGALTWGPTKRLIGAMPSRSSNSTILRISGRPAPGQGVPAPTGVAVPAASSGGDRGDEGQPATGVPGGPGRAA